jgi:hypothetical protein
MSFLSLVLEHPLCASDCDVVEEGKGGRLKLIVGLDIFLKERNKRNCKHMEVNKRV